MSFSSDAIPSIRKAQILSRFRAKLKEDSRTELLEESSSKKKPIGQFKIQILLGLTTTLGVSIQNRVWLVLSPLPSSITLAPNPSFERMISRAKLEMIVANSPNKMLLKLVPLPSAIDVKVIVTSQLSVVVKLRSPSLTEFLQKFPVLTLRSLHTNRIQMRTMILIMTKKVLVLSAIVLDSHLQNTYLSSDVYFPNMKEG